MVDNTTALSRQFSKRECPIIFFGATHEADKPEPPYPPHFIRGTGEELVRMMMVETYVGFRVAIGRSWFEL